MEAVNYEFEMPYRFEAFSVWKEKEALIIDKTFKGSRFNDIIQFEGYASITFDEADTQHRFAKVISSDKFVRRSTNCLVYNMINQEENHHVYDKMFIYHNVNNKMGVNYGFIMYNTKTGNTVQISDNPGNLNDLLFMLSTTFTRFKQNRLFEQYAEDIKQFESKLNRHAKTDDVFFG